MNTAFTFTYKILPSVMYS